jgi:hypothetical protein
MSTRIEKVHGQVMEEIYPVGLDRSFNACLRVHGSRDGVIHSAEFSGGVGFHLRNGIERSEVRAD